MRSISAIVFQAAGAEIPRTRNVRRDILRATVFLCITPLVIPRANSGCANFSAAAAASWLPAASASSTLRKKVRIRERRALLMSARASDWRARFFDCVLLAIYVGFRFLAYMNSEFGSLRATRY